MTKAAICLAALLMTYPTSAVELRIPVDFDRPTNVSEVTVMVQKADTPPRQTQAHNIILEIDPTHVLEQVRISTQGAPSAYDDFDLEMHIPFNMENGTIDLVAPILRTEMTIPHQGPLKSMRALAFGTDLSGLVKVNERALRALNITFRTVNSGTRPFNVEDGFLLMLFARSAATLVSTHFIQPDREMLDIMAFAEGVLADDVTVEKLFPTTRERQDLFQMVALFKTYRTAQLKRLVDATALLLGDRTAMAMQANCPVILDLAERIQTDQDRAPLTYQLRNLEDVVNCRTHDISWIGAPPDDADRRIEAAQQTLGRLNAGLAAFAEELGNDRTGDTRFNRATNRGIELANQLAVITSAMALESQ